MSQRHLNQTLTYWAPSAKDSTNLYGKPTSSAPVQLRCRWEDRNEQLRNKSGEEFISKSRVFVEEVIDIDGYVFLGTSVTSDPVSEPEAKEIQAIGRQPDLRGLRNLTVIYL